MKTTPPTMVVTDTDAEVLRSLAAYFRQVQSQGFAAPINFDDWSWGTILGALDRAAAKTS